MIHKIKWQGFVGALVAIFSLKPPRMKEWPPQCSYLLCSIGMLACMSMQYRSHSLEAFCCVRFKNSVVIPKCCATTEC